jgi:hypothetical protein
LEGSQALPASPDIAGVDLRVLFNFELSILLLLTLLELGGRGDLYENIIRHLAKILTVTVGRAAWEACSATWNLGTNSAFALGPRKPTENLDRVGRSQDLPDAN